jgi:hypothetical protein
MKNPILVVVVLIASIVFGLAGCGGGSSPASSLLGDAKVSVDWPAPTRLIPAAANSVKITITGPTGAQSQVVSRPAAVASQTTPILFTGVPIGDYTVLAEAFPTTNGTGIAQASGVATLTVTQGNTSTFSITLDSTVTNLTISPLTNPVINVAQTHTVSATDSTARLVLVDPAQFLWTSGSNATLNGAASATGNSVSLVSPALGSGGITVTYVEPSTAQPARTFNFTTANPVSVSVSPTTATLLNGDQLAITASVQNASNTSVTWTTSGPVQVVSTVGNVITLRATADSGAISATATSAQDSSKSATATLTAAPQLVVSLSPATTGVLVNTTTVFTASVANASSQSVTWVLTGNGTLQSSTATTATVVSGATAGSYVLTATSVQDTRRSATQNVTVSVSGGSVGGSVRSSGSNKNKSK